MRALPPRRLPPRSDVVDIAHLGDRGDGVTLPTDGVGRRYYVPGALPGEKVRVVSGARKGDGWSATLEEVLIPSPDRVVPPCPHAGTCGGCDLQHLAPAALAAWKRDKVGRALAHRGLETPVADLISIGPGTRRRLAVGLRGRKRSAVVGFFERASHRLIDTPGCLLPVAPLKAALAVLREALPTLLTPGEETQALLTHTTTGVDLVMGPLKGNDLVVREALVALADAGDFARIALKSDNGTIDPVAVRRPPDLTMGDKHVALPPGPFLQPSQEGEAALVRLVGAALGLPRPHDELVDLFCGIGTFAVPLAQAGWRVRAFDEAAPAVAALRKTGVQATARDLFRNPLAGDEWKGITAAVVDPPRAGAAGQAEALAESGPEKLVMVSCAPGTLARDLKVLTDGGYRITGTWAVDQFTWSHHVEVVAALTRT